MKSVMAVACWAVGTSLAADVPVKTVSCSGSEMKEAIVGVNSMSFSLEKCFSRVIETRIRLYCILPFCGMLAPIQTKQKLTVTDSNGVSMKLRSVQLDNQWIRDEKMRRVSIYLRLDGVPSPGARWVHISGHLFLPLSNGLESLDFGKVELKEGGVSIPSLDPVAVRNALENDGVDVADVAALETVVLKVTRVDARRMRLHTHERGEEWKFMVYADTMFRAENFIFHDMSGMELKPRKTCEYQDNGQKGKSFLFSSTPRFVDVSVLYQGPPRIRKIPVNLKLALGGVMPPSDGAPVQPAQTNASAGDGASLSGEDAPTT